MTNPGFGSGKVTRRGLGRGMRTSGRRNQPVIVIRRHQDQFPATMSRDLYRLTPSLVLDLAEIALELGCRSLGHN
jgi:hypothetical protein